MLIFDSFESREKAELFVSHCKQQFKRTATVFDSQEESNKVDLFPFPLRPPIVLVERWDGTFATDHEEMEREFQENKEKKIVNSVQQFNGSFAGT